MGDNKAPGPDGYGAGFYKAAWEIIGGDVCEAIQEFFQNGKLLREVNATSLVLIPKTECPNYAADFRPIACCNSIYKCITKIISNRLQAVLPCVVQENQTAFVAGRSIVHNVLISQELLRLYGRKHVSPRCLMKIDIKKAYDVLSWSFIEKMLLALKFPSQFIQWIMACITTASFTLVLNGRSFGQIRNHRGIRQGDPMSPLIFVLAMEMLSRKLMAASEKRGFRFHPMCRSLRLVNLAFADDLMVFCSGNEGSVTLLMQAFSEFSESSGLYASQAKSHIYMAGLSPVQELRLQQLTGFQKGSFPFKYLGLPISPQKWSASTCQVLADRITKRINSWRTRNLSYQGRVQLINSVLMSLHIYWATVFIIPKTVIKQIEQKCRIFLWGTNQLGRARSVIAWDLCCKPKKAGGLGFKNSILWNQAALGKQVWQLALKKDCLWVKWISSVYLKDSDFWLHHQTSQASWHWKQILKIREKFRLTPYGQQAGAQSREYSIRQGYMCLTGASENWDWCRLVWNGASVPKHCTILWLAAHDRLKTQANMITYSHNDPTCILCNDAYEDRDHICFECPWSKQLLELVACWIGLDTWHYKFMTWKNWMLFGFRDKHRRQMVVASMAATLYHTWMERNRRLYVGKSMQPSQVFNIVKKELAIRFTLYFKNLNCFRNHVLVDRIQAEL